MTWVSYRDISWMSIKEVLSVRACGHLKELCILQTHQGIWLLMWKPAPVMCFCVLRSAPNANRVMVGRYKLLRGSHAPSPPPTHHTSPPPTHQDGECRLCSLFHWFVGFSSHFVECTPLRTPHYADLGLLTGYWEPLGQRWFCEWQLNVSQYYQLNIVWNFIHQGRLHTLDARWPSTVTMTIWSNCWHLETRGWGRPASYTDTLTNISTAGSPPLWASTSGRREWWVVIVHRRLVITQCIPL